MSPAKTARTVDVLEQAGPPHPVEVVVTSSQEMAHAHRQRFALVVTLSAIALFAPLADGWFVNADPHRLSIGHHGLRLDRM